MYSNFLNIYQTTSLSNQLQVSKVTLTCQIIQHGDPGGVGHECDGKESLVSDVTLRDTATLFKIF